MTRRCLRTSAAERDVVQIATWLAERDVALAVRFLDATEETFLTLAQSPDLGSPYSGGAELLEGLRVWRVDGFRNHLIYYRTVDEGIQVVRVLHAARDLPAIFGES